MMKRIFTCFYFLLFLGAMLPSEANAQQQFKTTSTSTIGYLEYLPSDYHGNNNRYPVVIFLHGLGEKGPNSNNPSVLAGGVPKLTKLGPPKHVKNGTKFPFILISPQLKAGYGDWPTWYVMEVIEHVKKKLRIDESRIYLTGLSLGGGGVWTVAQEYPKYFAAVAPVCGSRNSSKKAAAIASAKLPVWAFHGDQDRTIPLGRSVNMVNAINAHNPDPRAKMTIYRGVKHNAWDNAYQPGHSVHSPNVYDWMLSHRRGKGNDSNTIPNKMPVANAGNDVTISEDATSFKLTGSGKDSDGKIVAYAWKKVSGDEVEMGKTDGRELTISGFEEGTYVFELAVRDDQGAVHTDQVSVFVKEDDDDDAKAPVANAGEDKTLTLPVAKLLLEGSATHPSGKKIKAFEWTKVSGGSVKMADSDKAILVLTSFAKGEYVFRLTVKDEKNKTHFDDVRVVVKEKEQENTAPIVNAGSDQKLTLPKNSVILRGNVKDNGKVKSYQWEKVSGKAAQLRNGNSAELQVSKLVVGTYVFRLTATDDEGMKSSDDVKVTVAKKKSSSKSSKKPVALAGKDQTFTLPVKSVTLHGQGTSKDGKIVAYSWKQVAGKKVRLSKTNSAVVSVSQVNSEGTRSFKLTVRDNHGNTAIDHVRIVFLEQKSVRKRDTSDSVQVVDAVEVDSAEVSTIDAVEENTRYNLGTDFALLENHTVVIFNDRGGRIYAGKWNEDSYSNVFQGGGLFIYHILADGRRVDSGKILVRP